MSTYHQYVIRCSGWFLILLFGAEAAWPCSYVGEVVKPLQRAVNAAGAIVVGRVESIEGPVVQVLEDGFEVREPHYLNVTVELVLKGDVGLGSTQLKVGESNMCSDIEWSYYFSIDYNMYAGLGGPRLLLMLRQTPEDEWVTASDSPAFMELSDGFDPENSPFLDTVGYIAEHGDYPFGIQVEGKGAYTADEQAPIEIRLSNETERAVRTVFPGPVSYDDSELLITLGVNDENEECPACYSHFVEPFQTGIAVTERAWAGDLNDFYPLVAPNRYAVEAYFFVQISPNRHYREFWGKHLRFSLDAATLSRAETWGQIKADYPYGRFDTGHAP